MSALSRREFVRLGAGAAAVPFVLDGAPARGAALTAQAIVDRIRQHNVARSVIGRNAFDSEMIWQAAFMDGFYSPGKERLDALGKSVSGIATALTLAADPQATNSIDAPRNVVPVSAKLTGVKSGFTYTVPADGIVVLTLETR